MDELKIGSEIWTLNPRSRRDGWEKHTITGETKQSWLVLINGWNERKFNKKTMLENHGPSWGHQRWYTPADKAAREFIDANCGRVADFIRYPGRQSDMPLTVIASQLKQIAEILGMELS